MYILNIYFHIYIFLHIFINSNHQNVMILRHKSLSTRSPVSRFRLSVIMFPVFENNRSQGTDVLIIAT